MITPPVVRSVLSLLGLAVASILALGTEDVRSLIEIGGFVVGIIGTAAVMQWRVKTVEKRLDDHEGWQQRHDREVDDWKRDHGQQHERLSEILAELKTMSGEQQRRLIWLENGNGRREKP